MVCEVCGKGFPGPFALSRHALVHVEREVSTMQCDICGKWLRNERSLYQHGLMMHSKEPQKCPHCGKIQPSKTALNMHISRSHSTAVHQCTLCSKSFGNAKSLKVCFNVILMHVKANQWYSRHQIYYFFHKIQEHEATHTGECLYQCSYCSQTFKSSSNKYKHVKAQHPEQWLQARKKVWERER